MRAWFSAAFAQPTDAQARAWPAIRAGANVLLAAPTGSGKTLAAFLAAIDAGADAVDGAIDAMSGLTSQPSLGAIVEALRHGPRDSGVDPRKLRVISSYWEQVRACYVAFESDLRAGASEVYVHGMPGGQFTNLREQARALVMGRRDVMNTTLIRKVA